MNASIINHSTEYTVLACPHINMNAHAHSKEN